MSLRLKLHLIVGSLSLLFVVAVLALQFDAMRQSVQEEVVAANRVAAQLLNRTALLYAGQGTPGMLSFLKGLGRVRSTEITLVDAGLRTLYQSPSSMYKVGRRAPAWFEALITAPPSRQSIEFSDGVLEMRANASRAALDAWDAFLPQIAGAGAMLVALNLLVAWVLGRTVQPFVRIIAALGHVEAGRFDITLPPLPGTEAAAIGGAFNRMVGVLQANIETEHRAVRAERKLSDNRELGRWIEHHVEKERRMIARELHDEFGQSVTAIRSIALSIAQRVQSHDAESERAARLIAAESSRLYDAMHGLIPRLAPLVLDSLGLAEALHDLVERTRASHPEVAIDLYVDLGQARIAVDVALALYRAAQEGITNTLRHSQANGLRLSLRAARNGVTLDLSDNGCGLPAEGAQRSGHYGLRWLAERVEGLGGRFAVEAASPQGVHLQVYLPCVA